MVDRATELEVLIAELCEFDAVENTCLAKSFTDRLLVLALSPGAELPSTARDSIEVHDFSGFIDGYRMEDTVKSLVDTIEGLNRNQFVDTQSPGEHLSYVVD